MTNSKNIPKRRFQNFESDGGWEQLKLGQHANILTGGTPNTSILNYWEPKEIPWMSSGEVNKRRLDKTDNMISKDGIRNSSARWVKKHSILIALAGQGKTRGMVAINNIPLTTNQSVAAIEPDKVLNYEFVFQNLSKRYNELRMISSGDGTRGGLNKQIVSDILISCPNVIEQELIGTFFADFDKYIILQQHKLEKMKNLKKSYLNELFPTEGKRVPKRRFSGFEGEWEQKKLGDVGKTFTGLSGKTKVDFGHGDGVYVTYLNIYSNEIANLRGLDKIEIDDRQTEIKYGDVFFTTSSETPEEVGLSSVWKYDLANVYLNSFCFGFRPNVKFDIYFLAYLLRSPSFRASMKLLAQGISRYNISKNRVLELNILFPSLKEQEKIGKQLSLLDKNIALQQQKLDKLKDLKIAYLNELFV